MADEPAVELSEELWTAMHRWAPQGADGRSTLSAGVALTALSIVASELLAGLPAAKHVAGYAEFAKRVRRRLRRRGPARHKLDS